MKRASRRRGPGPGQLALNLFPAQPDLRVDEDGHRYAATLLDLA